MYLVKANGNYNIVITDINVTVSSTTQPNGVEVEGELFESSLHAKDLLSKNLILVEKLKSNTETVVDAPKEELADKVEDKIFVARETEEETKSEDAFVAQKKVVEAKKSVEVKEEVKTEEVVVEKETKVEKTEVKEEAPAKEVKTEEKASAKKATTKRTNTTKGKK